MKTLHKIFVTTLLIISINLFGQNLASSNPTNEGGAIELINPLKTANNIANKWIFYNMTGQYGNSLQFWNYGSNGFYGSRFTILDNGNVGIGTTNPTEKLHVAGNGIFTGQIKSSDGSHGGTINLGDVTFLRSSFAGHSKLVYNLHNGNGYSDVMSINGNGNVGIGTTTPDAKLAVNGTIHAREVKVDLAGWPDYVFEKYYTGVSELKASYTLPTLAEVEQFTKENHHLPNVPSAKEVKENGLQLGEISNIMLQKIEELTLYVIEQNKRIEKLETENKKLLKNKNCLK
jgi:hypothetical protein